MAAINLKATPEKINTAANEFETHNNQMRSIMRNMIEAVDATKGVWQGTAANAYVTKVHALQNDMERLYTLVKEHVTDLHQIAQTYSTAESKNVELASGLPSDVVM